MPDPAAPTILVVDDQPLNLELVTDYLEGSGCMVVTAADGEAALAAVDRHKPDLVLLDVVMPRLDGIEVCRRLKANPATWLIPVVLVTSLSAVEDQVRGLAAGADDFLTKPIERHELLARVLTMLHALRVGRTARALAEAAGMSVDELDIAHFGGVVHDIGKVGVPDAVLMKAGVLSPTEIDVVRRHVHLGVEIARRLRSADCVIPIIKHHHERYDGRGYPDGLVGVEIPRLAMVVSICDAYDAMTSDRPYRAAMTRDEALAELRQGAGTQWDPLLVALFLSHVAPP